MVKFAQGDLIKVKHPFVYGPGRKRTVRVGTPGVVLKSLTGGQMLAYFHGHPVLIVGQPATLRHR